MELVDGLDVAEDGGDGLLGEEVLRPALLVHAELEHLGQKYFMISVAKIFRYFTKKNVSDWIKEIRLEKFYIFGHRCFVGDQ